MKGGKMDKTDKEIIGILRYEIVKKFNLQNDIVYIGQQNIDHIKKKHINDYNLFLGKLSEIIINPDYLGKHPHNGSIELIKELTIQETYYVKVAIRISKNGTLFVRTLYTLNKSKFFRKLKRNHYEKVLDIETKR
jgi:transposase